MCLWLHSKIFASSQQQSPALCSIKKHTLTHPEMKKKKILSPQKRRHIFSYSLMSSLSHTHTHVNISQWCSPHLRDPQSTPPQSLLPAVSVSSFPLSSPSPAAYELWPTNKQGHSKHVVPHEKKRRKSPFGPICNKYVALFGVVFFFCHSV